MNGFAEWCIHSQKVGLRDLRVFVSLCCVDKLNAVLLLRFDGLSVSGCTLPANGREVFPALALYIGRLSGF